MLKNQVIKSPIAPFLVAMQLITISSSSLEVVKDTICATSDKLGFSDNSFSTNSNSSKSKRLHEFTVCSFSSIQVSGPFVVLLRKAKKDENLVLKVELESGDATKYSDIDIDVKGGRCCINLKGDKYSYFEFWKIGKRLVTKEQSLIKVVLPYHSISHIAASNLASVKMSSERDILSSENLTLDVFSASSIDLKLKIANDLIVNLSSASSADFSECQAKRIFYNVNNASVLNSNIIADAFELKMSAVSKTVLRGNVKKATVFASSASIGDLQALSIIDCNAETQSNSSLILNVIKKLKASASSLSKIIYIKEPQKIFAEKSGMSQIYLLTT